MNIKPRNFIITLILIGINMLLYFIPRLFRFPVSLQELLMAGGISVQNIEAGEHYRLITAAFLHFDIRHIFSNMLILFMMGERTESIYGHFRFFLLCLFGILVPNVLSYWYYKITNEYVLSAGASGLVFALNGAMITAAVKKAPGSLDIRRLIFYTLFSLYAGFTSVSTNNIAHLSGVLAGFIIGFVLLPQFDPSEERQDPYEF